ncbi:nucleotidyltransferase [archaeon]|nr:nucleotidyltransferase [archaeon]|tara:strand:- start:113 stop:1354 length:1242 start_codon:yes stop_codon:yes gene_type:complete
MERIVVGRDQSDMKTYGDTGTLFIGKHIVGKGEDAHLTTRVLLDAIRPHVITICGKRGSGKSFSLGVFVEELFKVEEDLRDRLCSVMIDTQGIFWTMKNSDEENLALLKEWKLEPRGFNTSVYVPAGQKKTFEGAGVDFDDVFSFSPAELTSDDWLNVFELDAVSGEGIILEKVISRLKVKENYSLQDIIDSIDKERGFEKEKLALENMFIAAQGWGIFSEGTKAPEVLVGGKISILDVSLTPQSVRSLLIALVSRKILSERIKARRQEELVKIELVEKNKVPMCWILIDEAHNFAPSEGTVASSEIMGRLVKEGRQPGISTVFATQRPEKLHPDILAQSDIVLSHRLTSKADIDALRAIMQTYMMWDITKYLNELPRLKGTAIILDDSTERPYKIRVRPRQSWHAGASPTAI